jgi:hypothetical protein
MFEERKGKLQVPRNFVAESVTVEHADFAQAMKHAQVEHLPGGDQQDAEDGRPSAESERPKRAIAVKVTPADEDGALENFKPTAEEREHVDRVADPNERGTLAPMAKSCGFAPDPEVADPLNAQ